jgi:hypothetical protein
MKFTALAFIASLTVAGYAAAQSPDQAPSVSKPTSHACKKEVDSLCGRRAKGEEMSCIKDGLDLNKFSADCKTELTKAPAEKAPADKKSSGY